MPDVPPACSGSGRDAGQQRRDGEFRPHDPAAETHRRHSVRGQQTDLILRESSLRTNDKRDFAG